MSSSINRFIRLAVLVSAFVVIVAAFLAAVVVWPEYALYLEMGGGIGGYYQHFIAPAIVALLWWGGAIWLYIQTPQSRWLGLVLLLLCWLISPLISNLFPFLSYQYSDPSFTRYLPTLPRLLGDVITLGYLLCYVLLPVIGVLYILNAHPRTRHRLFSGLLLLCLLRYGVTLIILANKTTLLHHGVHLPGEMVSEWLDHHVQTVVSHYSVWPSLIAALMLYVNVFVWRGWRRTLAAWCFPPTICALLANLYMYHFALEPFFYALAIIFALFFTRHTRQEIIRD